MQQYKIEFFSNHIELKGFSPILESEILLDYQQLEQSKFTILFEVTEDIKVRDFVRVSSFYKNEVVFEGYISKILKEEGKNIWYCESLYKLLDFQLWYDRNNFKKSDLETNIEEILRQTYNNADKFKYISFKTIKKSSTNTLVFNLKDNIFNLLSDIIIKALDMYNFIVHSYLDVVSFKTIKKSSTNTLVFNLKDNIFNLLSDIIIKALDMYNFIVHSYLDVVDSRVVFELKTIPDNFKILELESSDIKDFEINNTLDDNAPNIITLIDKDSNEEGTQLTYYLLKDGSLATTEHNIERVFPPNHVYEYFTYTTDEYYEDVYSYTSSIARDRLQVKKYNHLIEVTILNSSKLVDIQNLRLGDRFRIYNLEEFNRSNDFKFK